VAFRDLTKLDGRTIIMEIQSNSPILIGRVSLVRGTEDVRPLVIVVLSIQYYQPDGSLHLDDL